MTDAKEAARRRLQQRRAKLSRKKLETIVARNKADWDRGCAWIGAIFSLFVVYVWLCEMGVI